MKNLRWYFYSVLVILISTRQNLSSQTPARSNFNFVFENNFNDDVLGKYLVSDYLKDFSPQPTNIPSQSKLEIIKDSDPKYDKFMRTYYPKGTYLPDQHGYLFMSYLKNPVDELYFSFDVRFKDGFQWVKGGKLPGLTGGRIVSGIYPAVNDGFSARMVWKENGKLYFYVYHQKQSGIYGDMIEWVNFKFTPGKWYNISMRLVVNTFVNGVAQSDGILEGFVDGKLYVQKTGLKFRGQEQIKIDDMYICSFFGGNTPDWATVRDEWTDIDNFVSFTYNSSAVNVPRGRQLSSVSKLLLHPYYSFGVSTPTPAVPATPALLSASASNSSISLTWKDNCTTENGFTIECRPNTSGNYTQIANVPANTTAFTHTGLASGTSYQYRMRAWNAAGSSSYSNILQATTTSSSSSSSSGSSELIAKYTYENSISDVSGHGYNGSLVNGATYSNQFKEGTKSLLLDGINDHANLGKIDLGNQFTFASWVYIPSSASNIQTVVANTSSAATSNGFKLCINTYGTKDGKVILDMGNGTSNKSAYTLANKFTFDRWNHLAVTINKTTGTARIYVNGIDVTVNSSLLSNFNSYQTLILGMMTNGGFPFKGNLDDTRIYNRALTSSEIQNLFSSGNLKIATTEFIGTAILMPDNTNKISPVVYPNPFKDHATLKSLEKIKSLEIYDMKGSKIFEQREMDSNEIEITNMIKDKSVYILKVTLQNNELHTIKVIKSN